MVQLGIRPISYKPKQAILTFDDGTEATLEIRARVWQKHCDNGLFLAWKAGDKNKAFFNVRAALGPNVISGPVTRIRYFELVAATDPENEKLGCVMAWFRIEANKLDHTVSKKDVGLITTRY